MSRFKTAAISRSYHNSIVGRRKGSYVRFWDPATATLSKWTRDPSKPFHTAERAVRNTLADVAETMGKMTVAELRTLAGNRGIKVPSKMRKSEIISALTN